MSKDRLDIEIEGLRRSTLISLGMDPDAPAPPPPDPVAELRAYLSEQYVVVGRPDVVDEIRRRRREMVKTDEERLVADFASHHGDELIKDERIHSEALYRMTRAAWRRLAKAFESELNPDAFQLGSLPPLGRPTRQTLAKDSVLERALQMLVKASDDTEDEVA